MSTPLVELGLNLASLAGIAILAVPALKLNKNKKQQARALVRALEAQQRGNELTQTVANVSATKRTEEVARWSRLDEVCLYVGYACLFGSNAVRFAISWGAV